MSFIRQLGPVTVTWPVGTNARRFVFFAGGANPLTLGTGTTAPAAQTSLIWTPTLDQYDKLMIEIQMTKTVANSPPTDWPAAWTGGVSLLHAWAVCSEASKAFLRVADTIPTNTSLPYLSIGSTTAGHKVDLAGFVDLLRTNYPLNGVSSGRILVSSRLNNEGIKPFVSVGYYISLQPTTIAPDSNPVDPATVHSFAVSIREYGSELDG